VNVIGNVHGLENISGTLWEHFGNPVGSLWEVCENQGIAYSVLYKYNMVCYVVHTLHCIVPTYNTVSAYYMVVTRTFSDGCTDARSDDGRKGVRDLDAL
jgi:hypothetical protein